MRITALQWARKMPERPSSPTKRTSNLPIRLLRPTNSERSFPILTVLVEQHHTRQWSQEEPEEEPQPSIASGRLRPVGREDGEQEQDQALAGVFLGANHALHYRPPSDEVSRCPCLEVVTEGTGTLGIPSRRDARQAGLAVARSVLVGMARNVTEEAGHGSTRWTLLARTGSRWLRERASEVPRRSQAGHGNRFR